MKELQCLSLNTRYQPEDFPQKRHMNIFDDRGNEFRERLNSVEARVKLQMQLVFEIETFLLLRP